MNFTTIFCDFTYLFLFLVVLGRCCEGFSLVAASRGYSLVAVLRLLIEVAPLLWSTDSRVRASEVVVPGSRAQAQ